MAIIPRTSEQKIALICAEINSLRKSVESLGSSVIKYDNALQNAVNTVLDVCKQYERGIELAKDIGGILSSTVNGDTPITEQINTVLNSGFTKLPKIPLQVGDTVSSLIDKVYSSDFGDIDSDMQLSQLCKFSPDAFKDVQRQLSFIPDASKTDDDKAVDSLVKSLDFDKVLSSTESALQKTGITNTMSNLKESITQMDIQIANQAKQILESIMPNLNELNPFGSGSGSDINGIPFSLEQIPGLNSESLTQLTQAGNLSAGSSASFYIELGCQIAKEVGETIETVNKFMNRFENAMPSDAQLDARLDRLVRQQFNKLLQDISGLTIGELEILQQECGELFN
jgi:hypothetical protein